MSRGAGDSPWFVRIGGARAPVRLRLFMIPYGGAGPLAFRDWAAAVPKGVEVVAVQLPGREQRLAESPFADATAVVGALFTAIAPWLHLPFVFFGHSMGAMLSFEMARRLQATGQPIPAHLFVSGFRAPHLPDQRLEVSCLDDEAFRAELERLGGTPPAVLDDEELMRLILPTLRADFRLVETYAYTPTEPLRCPITAFAGSDDEDASPEMMEAWGQHTARDFRFHRLTGGHFFVHTDRERMRASINERLSELLACAASVH